MKTFVCRCEDVTVHEIEHAMENGYRDLESVKRYTGFGTGWCQGKNCLAACARVIQEKGGDASLPFTARPPFHPVPLGALVGLADPSIPNPERLGDEPHAHAPLASLAPPPPPPEPGSHA